MEDIREVKVILAKAKEFSVNTISECIRESGCIFDAHKIGYLSNPPRQHEIDLDLKGILYHFAPRHLHITAPMELKENDWVINTSLDWSPDRKEYLMPFKVTADRVEQFNDNKKCWQKVIGSTDDKIGFTISEDFIQRYLSGKNYTDEIKTALIKFVDNEPNVKGSELCVESPKVIKQNFTREEVLNLMAEAHNHGYTLCLGTSSDALEFEDWIKENL